MGDFLGKLKRRLPWPARLALGNNTLASPTDTASKFPQALGFHRRGDAGALNDQPRPFPGPKTKLLTTVFCAVWHKDPKRLDLLRGHAENLKRQTVPVESIYVFDGADEPPTWLEARAVSVREPLTIYQAWNVALSLVSTPLAMNLNLDDRLASDAVELLEREMQKTGAVLAGGDWKICYSQGETDAVNPCYSAELLPFVPDWPPRPGTSTRLGSGTGARGTFGPATIWRLDAHIGYPRYPWRLSDGTLLRVAGDAAWWTILTQKAGLKALRLPVVIGNYHSHPEDQAEFRSPDEVAALVNRGLSLT